MSQKYEKLKAMLKELFQLDQPDLDFGLYRIMHAKSAEVTQFLDKDLLPQVKEAFGLYKTADKAELGNELSKAIEKAQELGADPETLPKVKELRAKLSNDAVDVGALENEVYDHLFSFFRRYYSEGDFLAKRVYKPGVYAIPYEGEEVTLHWANKDQYYIKTSEYLRDYAFRLRPENEKNPMRVHFRLADAAEEEHGNIKTAEGKDRVFILAAKDFLVEEDGEQGKELIIRFEYRPTTLTDWPENVSEGKTKPPAQKDLLDLAAKRVLSVTDVALAVWIAELAKPHIKADGEKAEYNRLEAHLKRYSARNTFDYFIHKDLGGFLRRELDFYIKNEVMHLDDVENETAPRVEQYLSKIKIVRKIAGKIIEFLAQLEEFQKKLWLKKKFVVETQYCITVGCIPDTFYPEIAANEAQREEWVKLFAIDEIKRDLTTPDYSVPLTVDFLKAHPTLVIDTRYFDADFTARLLEAIGDVDEQIDGVLFHGENFQALSLMQVRYCEQVSCIYIDPPYNTGSDGFAYKDSYQHSSWLSMLSNGISLLPRIWARDGLFTASIDSREQPRLRLLLDQYLPDTFVADIANVNNPQGRSDEEHIATAHENLILHAGLACETVGWDAEENVTRRFRNEDQLGSYRETDLRKTGKGDRRVDRQNLFYYFHYCIETNHVLPSREEHAPDGYIVIKPIRPDGSEGRWRWELNTSLSRIADLVAKKMERRPVWTVYEKDYLSDRQKIKPSSVWTKPLFNSHAASNALRSLGFSAQDFAHPKPVNLISHIVKLLPQTQTYILDYFGGSGTTGHAVINLNREDGGSRKFILVEMGDYFDTVLLPRIKKVTFTPEWKDGKPERLATAEEADRSPRIVKVIRLESYEDALNNLETRRIETQQNLLDAAEAQGADGLKEQYLLRYMLNVETRGSQSLLNINAFKDPTAYKLKVKLPGSDESREVNIDLLETFNWLIGLTVRHIAAPQSFSASFERDSEKRLRLKGRLKQDVDGIYWFRTVTGTTPDGRKTLIIWRKLTGKPEQDNLVLDEWFTKQGYSTKDYEFQLIYVNGDNNLENLKAPDDTWKVRLIEEDFHRLMFDTESM